MAHRVKGGRGHPARISGKQKFLREKAVNDAIVNRDGSIKEFEKVKFKQPKGKKRRKKEQSNK